MIMNITKHDLRILEIYCKSDIKSLLKRLKADITHCDNGQYYGHIDNGSNVLAVAHLDIVAYLDNSVFAQYGDKVISPALDDRLGLWIIAHLLPISAMFN